MKPELSYQEEVTVEYYEETNIEIKVTASPKPKVKWYNNFPIGSLKDQIINQLIFL